jgi:hypothetical protein
MMKKQWTPAEDRHLADIYPKTHNHEVAKLMNRTYGSIIGRASILGLKKDPGYIHELLMIEAQKLQKLGGNTRFTKGRTPVNKGVKLTADQKAKIQYTFFPKGHIPANLKPIGSERISQDGYIMVKIRNGKYVLKHRLIWEMEHGRVPAGHCLKFIDGNPLNCVLSNIRLTTKKAVMEFNQIHNLPDDIKEVIRLKTKINRICDAKKQD